MHSLYESKCAEDDKLPLKEHMYRKVFNCEFNLAFHVPKTDRFDVCEEKKVAEKNGTELSEEVKTSHAKHVKGKLESKEERDKDRASDDPVLCFDMDNVFSLPKGDVSSFFFLQKEDHLLQLNCYSYLSQTYRRANQESLLLFVVRMSCW